MNQTQPSCIITKKGTKSAYTTILEAIGLLLLLSQMLLEYIHPQHGTPTL